MGYFGHLINAGVRAVGGGLKGQNEGDEKLYERRREKKKDDQAAKDKQTELLLKRYAEKRALARENREATTATRTTKHYDWQDRPEWERQGYPSFEAWDADTHEPAVPAERNIDRLSPEGQAAEIRLQRALSNIPSRSRRGTPEGDEEDVRDLNTVIDDADREVGRAERELPKPWSQFTDDQKVFRDSSGYVASQERQQAKVDSLRTRRDRFATTRDSLVAKRHGMDRPAPVNPPPGVVSDVEVPIDQRVDSATLSAGAGHSATPAPTWNGLTREDIERQYQEALAWRGPNGERKNPEALKHRLDEALALLALQQVGQ